MESGPCACQLRSELVHDAGDYCDVLSLGDKSIELHIAPCKEARSIHTVCYISYRVGLWHVVDSFIGGKER